MKTPECHQIRFRVDPGDIPAEKAARRLHLTLAEFNERLPSLLDRGFPPADPTTGNYDLEAIDVWRRLRNKHLYDLTAGQTTRQPESSKNEGMGDRFASTKRGRHDPTA